MHESGADIKITFGMIVLNGEPFIKYNLRALYPFAHQIIVVEGANIHSTHCATADGHSLDETLRILKEFKDFEDPKNKVVIVTAEDEGHPNGFWPGEKDEQSQAYSRRATGNWLWQIDVDEFYMEADVRSIIKMLEEDPTISTVSFLELPFWGSFDYRCDGILLRIVYSEVHRLFKWEPGYKYVTHRPPSVVNDTGVDLRRINWVRAGDLKKRGIYMYHYYKIFPGQVSSKMIYYANRVEAYKEAKIPIIKGKEYFDRQFLKLTNPFRIHMYNKWPSWLEKFDGNHPVQIQALRNDMAMGIINVSTRNMEDADVLVKSIRYRIGILFWKIWGNYVSQINRLLRDFLRRRIGLSEFYKTLFHILIGKKRLF